MDSLDDNRDAATEADNIEDVTTESVGCAPTVTSPVLASTVSFREVDSILRTHLIELPTVHGEREVFGVGGAIVDINKDGYLDVFLSGGTADGQTLVFYRNVHAPGGTPVGRDFEAHPVEGLRGAHHGGYVYVRQQRAQLLTYGSEYISEVVLEYREPEASRSIYNHPNCDVFAVVHRSNGVFWSFFGTPSSVDDGEQCITVPLEVPVLPEAAGSPQVQPPSETLYTLVATRVDMNDDGILDTAVGADTFPDARARNLELHPGGAIVSGTPLGPRQQRIHGWTTDRSAWGSHMGIAVLRTRNENYTVLSNAGLPLIRGKDGLVAPFELRAASDRALDEPGYSWSPIIVDFNGDQRDDILLTRGTIHPRDHTIREDDRTSRDNEADVLFIQNEDGEFVDMTEGSGLLAHPPAYPDDHELEAAHVSRAGLATDFDRDGRVDVLILPYEGRPLHYEAEAQTHCLARVTPAYSPPHDALYGWSWLDHELGEHPVRVDGHMFLGEPEYMLVPAIRGAMRAPSGARIPYECEPGDLVDVVEPAWATVDGATATLELCAAGLDPSLIQSRTADGELQVEFVNDSGSAEVDLSDGAVDLFIDGRYAVTCYPDGDCIR